MDSVLDAIIAFITRAAETPLGVIALTSPIWLLAVVRTWQAVQRRRAFREFAAAHQLRFVGIIPSDKHAPYTRIELVKWAVLLYNVVEGLWDGEGIHLFDMPTSRRSPAWTMIFVIVSGTLHRGPQAERVIGAGPKALIETNLDLLCVSPRRRLQPSELTTWLSFATTLAKAMERDEKEAVVPSEPAAPTPARGMFGTFT